MGNKIQYVDISSLTEAELIEIIRDNHRSAKLLREEIKKLEQANSNIKTQKIEQIDIPQEPEIFIEEEIIEEFIDDDSDEYSFEKEVSYYLEELKKVTTLSEISVEEMLPSKSNYNYEKIINRLRLEIIKEIQEIKEFITQEMSNFTSSDLKEFQNEIKIAQEKLKILTKELTAPKEELIEAQKENKLIFVPTSGGAPRALEEIEDMSIEYHEGFLGLFQSIKNGTFKGVERFASTNNTLAGMSKLKDFQIRIVFDRIDKDKYAIVTAFIKKSYNAKSYLSPLQLKVANYRTLEPKIKELIKDEKYLEQQEEYERRLFETLTKGKVK